MEGIFGIIPAEIPEVNPEEVLGTITGVVFIRTFLERKKMAEYQE